MSEWQGEGTDEEHQRGGGEGRRPEEEGGLMGGDTRFAETFANSGYARYGRKEGKKTDPFIDIDNDKVGRTSTYSLPMPVLSLSDTFDSTLHSNRF